jgi:hypothetical protein
MDYKQELYWGPKISGATILNLVTGYLELGIFPPVRKYQFTFINYTILLGAFAKLRKATVSFVMHVSRSAWNNSAPNGWVWMKLDIRDYFENLSKKNSSFIKIRQ